MPDSKAQAVARHHQIEDVDETPEEVKDTVRRLIAANAVGESLGAQIADAELIMMALGIHPTQCEVTYETRVAPLPNAPSSRSLR